MSLLHSWLQLIVLDGPVSPLSSASSDAQTQPFVSCACVDRITESGRSRPLEPQDRVAALYIKPKQRNLKLGCVLGVLIMTVPLQ